MGRTWEQAETPKIDAKRGFVCQRWPEEVVMFAMLLMADSVALPPRLTLLDGVGSATYGVHVSIKGDLLAYGKEVLWMDSVEFPGKVWGNGPDCADTVQRETLQAQMLFSPVGCGWECLRLQNSMNFPSWKLSMGINRSKLESTKQLSCKYSWISVLFLNPMYVHVLRPRPLHVLCIPHHMHRCYQHNLWSPAHKGNSR